MWSVYVEANFLQALIAPEYSVLESFGINWGIGYCKNTFASFGEWFVNLLVFTTENIKPFLELFKGVNSVAYFLSFHSLGDKLEQVTLLSLITGVSHFLILGENFP